MSIEEQNEVKKAMRIENLIRDAVKGSFLTACVYILFNSYDAQYKRTIEKVDKLEEQVLECNSDKQEKTEQAIFRIENFVISKNKSNVEN